MSAGKGQDRLGGSLEASVGQRADENFVVHATAGGKVYLLELTSSGGVFTFGDPVEVIPFSGLL